MHVLYACVIWLNHEISDEQKILGYKVHCLHLSVEHAPRRNRSDCLEEGHIYITRGNRAQSTTGKEDLDEDRESMGDIYLKLGHV